ncbi:hypothetical protein L3Q82_022343, partial [Scortum barcoo]
FPPDVLHDLLEGVVPVELAHCLKAEEQLVEMVTRTTLCSDYYVFSLAPKSKSPRGQILGGAHGLLKDIVKLVVSHAFTDNAIQYIACFPNTMQMEATDVLKLRVILDDVNAEKLILPSRPDTVNALIFVLKNKLNLGYDFRLQFQDPEFDNALCNLVNIEDLPSKATIMIVRFVDLELSSTSTDETVLLSDHNRDSPERLCRWPEIFIVPTFSYEVEYALREGNSVFVKDGKTAKLPRDQKHNILDVMAAEIYRHKAYPSTKQIGKAAEALVSKHPCLKEHGFRTGYDGWKNSLRFKMGNYRTKLSRAGIKHVAVNAGKYNRANPEGAASRAKIKTPRRGEINFLPNYPLGETKDTMEILRLEMVEQFKICSAPLHLGVKKLWPPIAELKERWPALFIEVQLYSEFHRITNQNLPFPFFAALDKYTPQLLKLYKKRKTGHFGEKMEEVLMAYEEQDKNDITAARTAALAACNVSQVLDRFTGDFV